MMSLGCPAIFAEYVTWAVSQRPTKIEQAVKDKLNLFEELTVKRPHYRPTRISAL